MLNRQLWGIRIYYFLWIGGGGFLLPFITIFYVQQGLNGAEIGWISTISSFLAVIFAPLWGRWSDSLSHPRPVMQIMIVGTAVFYMVLSQQHSFWPILALYVPLGILGAGLAPISDTLTLSITGGTRSGYGSVRLWGSLGWALLAFGSGYIIERTGLFTAFTGYAITLGISALILSMSWLRGTAKPQTPAPQPQPALAQAVAPASGWKTLLRQPALVGLALTLIAYLLTNNPQAQFEPIYLTQLGGAERIVGLASTVGALAELPCMLLADRLIRRYSSLQVLLWSFFIRIGLQAIILLFPSVPTIIAMRAVNAIGFSFFTVASTVFVAERSPQQSRATAMAVFGMTLPALIKMLSGPLGGWAFDSFGAYWLYAIALVGNGLAWAILYFTVKEKPNGTTTLRAHGT